MVALLVVPSVGLQLSGPRDASSIDRMAQLWDGIDVEGLHFNDTGLGAPGCPSCTSLALSTGLPKFQILGMFDTGTNLLGELMAANFGREAFGRMCPEFAKGEGFDCQFDKHRPPQDVDPRGLHIVALVRSPLASIAAWRKAPYDLETCFESVDWLHDHDANCSVGKKQKWYFSGPTGYWNDYVNGYRRLLASGHNVKIVEYENLVLNTEDVMRGIGEFIGVPMEAFHQYEMPSKDHGDAIGREGAVLKIRNMTYMQALPWSHVGYAEAACRNIDSAAMAGHRIQLSPSEGRLYTSDCEFGANVLD